MEMEVGRRLAQAREYLELSQEQVADILEITIEEVRIYEGRHFINPIELKPFLELYRVTKEDLYENDKDITKYVKGFEKLSKKDKKEVVGLLRLLKEFKKRR